MIVILLRYIVIIDINCIGMFIYTNIALKQTGCVTPEDQVQSIIR